MKRSTYFMQLLLLLVVKVLISACDPDLPTAPDSKGPGENHTGQDITDISTDYYAEETFEFEFAAKQKSKLTLKGVNGNIYVEQLHAQSSFKVVGTKKAYSYSQQEAENQLYNLEVAVEDNYDELKVTTIQPQENGKKNFTVDYWICLPKNVELKIYATNSKVTLQEVEADAEVEVANGKIAAQVSLTKNGELKMKNVNGDMLLSLPKSTYAQFSAETTNGKIEVKNLNLFDKNETNHKMSGKVGDGEGAVYLKSTNGDIEILGF